MMIFIMALALSLLLSAGLMFSLSRLRKETGDLPEVLMHVAGLLILIGWGFLRWDNWDHFAAWLTNGGDTAAALDLFLVLAFVMGFAGWVGTCLEIIVES